jgi:hypothetical protein
MALSISSSERSVFVYALAALVFMGLALVNNSKPDTSYEFQRKDDRFWLRKVFGHAPGTQNIIMIGDSRLYRGLSPAAFEAALPGTKALNYGFSSGGHNPVIFADVDRMLTTDRGKPRAVILAITPHSLTPRTQANEHYLSYRRRHGESAEATPFSDYFRPLDSKRMRKIITGNLNIPTSDEISEYHDDGWLQTDWVKHDPAYALSSYQELFTNNTVSQSIIDDVYRQTKIWRNQGIIVIGYRPPTTSSMLALETAKSGFDESAFRAGFTKAGGLWVEPGPGYKSYDGSHLTPESAKKLSDLLAKTLVRALPGHTN